MQSKIRLRMLAMAFLIEGLLFRSSMFAEDHFFLDDLPDHVAASMEQRAKMLAALPQSDGPGFEFNLDDLQKWDTGQSVRVAFLGGDTALHREIAEATVEITNACNIKLDFGFNSATGQYRRWTSSDTAHSAEIRVSFDQSGYFSLIGRDSVNGTIGLVGTPVGGRPNQRSLNLGGFLIARPANWKKTVRHEFLHALAFKHEHQSPLGGCDAQFRWEDDQGYSLTQNTNGEFITDTNGKRPGIYTYLSGAPNGWSRSKVDHNLRQASPGSGIAGPFDRESIMLYRFPSLFYVSTPNPCAPVGSSENLSVGDIKGLKLLYPFEAEFIASQSQRQAKVRQAISKSNRLDSHLKQRLLQ
jgi:hypothetical protein